MKKKILLLILFILFISILGTQSCTKDFLNVSNNLAGQLTMEKIFNNPDHTREWFSNIFSKIENPSTILVHMGGVDLATGFDDPWAALSGAVLSSFGRIGNLQSFGYNASNFPVHRWTGCYQEIRQINIFLEHAKPLPSTSQNSLADFISEPEMKKMKAEARFMRAYYYWLLFELYGPVPIDTVIESPTNPKLDFARNSVDEVVDYIYRELTSVMDQLDPVSPDQNHNGMPTKGAALALRAKLMVFAASPLFNGGYGQGLTNKDGKHLFPTYSADKWQRALDACQAFIDFASNHYHLYKLYNSDGTYNPDSTLYEMFMRVAENPGVIWANPNSSASDWGDLRWGGYEYRTTPHVLHGDQGLSVSQKLVDAFFMNDGLSINESPLYKKTGFSQPGDDTTGRTDPGTFNQWVNRGPRFYATVFYNGEKWPIEGRQIFFDKGSPNNNVGRGPKSGYLLRKRSSKEVFYTGSYPKHQYRPVIIFRLAEFYLLYAEALNEVDPGDPRIIKYIDLVRDRAGIPLLKDIEPGIIGNKEAQEKAIRHEMRVELCTEGQRYFNIRRWMIATDSGSEQGGPFYGMNLNGAGDNFYKKVVVENRVWKKAMYLAPIPFSEMQKSNLLVQNPGW